MVSYGGKTIPRWRTAAILKIDISPYLSEKLSDFHDVMKQDLAIATDRASAAHTIRRGHLRGLEIYVITYKLTQGHWKWNHWTESYTTYY